jgi:hypothetical protein
MELRLEGGQISPKLRTLDNSYCFDIIMTCPEHMWLQHLQYKSTQCM